MSQFFIDRPIFASVISVLIVLAGGIFVWTLPVAQYPEITPPSVLVTTKYPGASSEVVAETVAAPIEQQVTGVENMLYMSSQSTNDGGYSLTVTFEVGTDLDMAQVLVQNRVNLATPTLPTEVKNIGVSVVKASASSLLAVTFFSPDQTRDQLYLSNFGTIRVKDELARIEGVGNITIIGQRDYSMRVWLDPNRMAALGLVAGDVIASLREQNIQVAAGALGRPPVPSGLDFQYTLKTLGRLSTADEFADIIIKTGQDGQIVRLRDVATDRRTDEKGNTFGGIAFGAGFEDTKCKLDGVPASGLMIYQLPGSNALDTANRVREKMDELRKGFPAGVEYTISYDTTPFISESIHEVFKSLRDAIFLVAIVVLVFLQSWRAAIIPLIAVPVAIIGTFAVMAAIGFSLNNLSLFGLVLAIGIVVDDAIVVVEAIEHKLEHGMGPVEASKAAMLEVTTPIIAISAVLMCVFIPCLFISGITGQFFKQFAATIAVSTFFSAVNSLTLSPALSALLLRPKSDQRDWLSRFLNLTLGWFFKLFNRFFGTVSEVYAGMAGWLVRMSVIVLVIYAGLIWGTYKGMTTVPAGFVPSQDKGYLLVDIQLPDSASLERTEKVVAKLSNALLGKRNGDSQHLAKTVMESRTQSENTHSKDAALRDADLGDMAGVDHMLEVVGQSFVQGAVGSNFASIFVILDPFHDRQDDSLYSEQIAMRIRQTAAESILDARVAVFGPPPVDGLGSGGGLKIMVRDIGQIGLSELEKVTGELAREGSSQPDILGMQSGFRADTPQMFVDVDREKCKAMNVLLSDVFTTLQLYLGGYYVNDFNAFGRTWQVNLQADPLFRLSPEQVTQLYVRSVSGEMVPLGALCSVHDVTGPASVQRYNGFAAAAINGLAVPGVSSGDSIKTVERVVADTLPFGFDTQWTELTYLQIQSGNTALIVFALAVVLVFLVLAAQYESLKLPFAVVLVVPMCLLCSVIGVALAGMDINIFVQIGFVVLVGLASKNAILIVEFANEQQEQGLSKFDATIEACRLRLRPIIMTSLAFILGVVPLVLGSGAGAEMRSTLGVAVFSGMLGVTFFGIFLTPVFYYVLAGQTKKET
ncbi:efflux RND transporter permease subunit [Rhodopirellula sp. MGV]|uniref:efflux RND transporter permease subunit n=1 Tax=Rhodopirellula sp. MGV TaxID=2023130 RepID=UPI000B9654E7|nr:efflux RND transporter permease subunit [Rhodopirellula sp. MGV]OYP35196.1 hydrophobe/amphiphile efflux-1 family RND transporter [Rhodopirellula sp. MGV]PNY37790.1 AcrB/AcrD/AcrF family protein [Rhodopirellula baltica]